MISVCIAICDNNTSCLQYALESLKGRTNMVSEILVADFNFTGLAQDKTTDLSGVPVTQFRYDYPITQCYCHAVGLHQCIKRAKNDYLILMDHDVIIYKPGFDQFFLEILDNHDLTMLGLQHYKPPMRQAFLHFPTVITAMVRKSQLPQSDWLAGKLKYRHSIIPDKNDPADNYPIQHENFFMIQTPIPDMRHIFPNPEGHYDTGCNFWIWVAETGGRWMSFLRGFEKGMYSTRSINNFGLPEDHFGHGRLLFHSGATKLRVKVLREHLAKSKRATTR